MNDSNIFHPVLSFEIMIIQFFCHFPFFFFFFFSECLNSLIVRFLTLLYVFRCCTSFVCFDFHIVVYFLNWLCIPGGSDCLRATCLFDIVSLAIELIWLVIFVVNVFMSASVFWSVLLK